MTVDEAIEQGRAWMAAGLYWAPGMRDVECGAICCEVGRDGVPTRWYVDGYGVDAEPGEGAVPDPRDPGFIGHALAQVREAWGRPTLYIARIDCKPAHSTRTTCWKWTVYDPDRGQSVCGLYDDEVEALLAARKEAP